MTNQPNNNTDDNPQNMSADEFFNGNESDKNTKQPSQVGEMMDDLNENLENMGINIDTQNVLVQLAVNVLPLPYSRKRYLQMKVRRGETVTLRDIVFGQLTVTRVIRSVIGFGIFIVVLIVMSRFG